MDCTCLIAGMPSPVSGTSRTRPCEQATRARQPTQIRTGQSNSSAGRRGHARASRRTLRKRRAWASGASRRSKRARQCRATQKNQAIAKAAHRAQVGESQRGRAGLRAGRQHAVVQREQRRHGHEVLINRGAMHNTGSLGTTAFVGPHTRNDAYARDGCTADTHHSDNAHSSGRRYAPWKAKSARCDRLCQSRARTAAP
jgi:hypothetical protein